jgi:hypothetical protein
MVCLYGYTCKDSYGNDILTIIWPLLIVIKIKKPHIY